MLMSYAWHLSMVDWLAGRALLQGTTCPVLSAEETLEHAFSTASTGDGRAISACPSIPHRPKTSCVVSFATVKLFAVIACRL